LKTLEAEVEDDVAEVGKELNQNDSKATLSLRKNTKLEVEQSAALRIERIQIVKSLLDKTHKGDLSAALLKIQEEQLQAGNLCTPGNKTEESIFAAQKALISGDYKQTG
jgi:uncharacterized protein YajQ (UPF0234 family)